MINLGLKEGCESAAWKMIPNFGRIELLLLETLGLEFLKLHLSVEKVYGKKLGREGCGGKGLTGT